MYVIVSVCERVRERGRAGSVCVCVRESVCFVGVLTDEVTPRA